MAEIAILIGFFSYLTFAFGLLGFLDKKYLTVLSIGFIVSICFVVLRKRKFSQRTISLEKISFIFLALLLCQLLINLVGALGPELGFDALWYHLTLPKIYLASHKITFIPGNLLYYNAMPKLVEMVYVPALVLGGETAAKTVHFIFGVLSAIALFNLARRYLKVKESLLVTMIFYTTLVVGWQSITAYVDLGRTFFEILAFDYFLRWYEKEKRGDLIESAIFLGLAIATKLLAFGSLPIYLILIFLLHRKNLRNLFGFSFQYSVFSLLIPLPWFVISFIHTGNPVYPLFAGILDSSHKITAFNLWGFIKDFWDLFLRTADPLSPLILIFLPLLGIFWKKTGKTGKIVVTYCLLAYISWYFIPRTGGGRFFLPYLPAFALVCGFIYEKVGKTLKKPLLIFIIIITFINIIVRGGANSKYLPVIFGKQTKADFLTRNLNFNFGDFFDVDGFFKKNIEQNDLVLVSGIHNLFYLDFPFVEESWVKKGTPITHILLKGKPSVKMALRLKGKTPIYSNRVTAVQLFVFGEKW